MDWCPVQVAARDSVEGYEVEPGMAVSPLTLDLRMGKRLVWLWFRSTSSILALAKEGMLGGWKSRGCIFCEGQSISVVSKNNRAYERA